MIVLPRRYSRSGPSPVTRFVHCSGDRKRRGRLRQLQRRCPQPTVSVDRLKPPYLPRPAGSGGGERGGAAPEPHDGTRPDLLPGAVAGPQGTTSADDSWEPETRQPKALPADQRAGTEPPEPLRLRPLLPSLSPTATWVSPHRPAGPRLRRPLLVAGLGGLAARAGPVHRDRDPLARHGSRLLSVTPAGPRRRLCGEVNTGPQ